MPEPLLELNDVTKQFVLRRGSWRHSEEMLPVVSGVSWTLHPGEALGVVGESGCGKTTVARMIVGLERPTSGEIRFKNRPFADWLKHDAAAFHRLVQMVFQDPAGSLNPRQRIRDILDLQLRRLTSLDGSERSRRIREVLEQMQLSESALGRFPHEFSGGQTQRISIARTLVSCPELMVLDEPVSALDVSVQAQILHLLDSMRRELGIAYIFISHDLAVVEQICPRTVVMYAGTIAEQGPTAHLFRHRKHPYTDLLVRSVPVPGHPLSLELNDPGEVTTSEGCVFRKRCPYPSARCKTAPALQPVSTSNPQHCYACHHPLEEKLS